MTEAPKGQQKASDGHYVWQRQGWSFTNLPVSGQEHITSKPK